MKSAIGWLRLKLSNPWTIVLLLMAHYVASTVPSIWTGPLRDWDMPTILASLEEDHSLRAVASWFTGPWVQAEDYYRPLTSVVHWANFLLCGDSGFCWRLVNVLIVAATMPAIVWMFSAGLKRPWAGVITAALLPWFHPVASMVAYPAWRTDLLCGIFLMLATGAALCYLREGARRWLYLMLAMLLLAIGFKEVAFAWPAFLALACLFIRRDRRAAAAICSAFGLAALLWLLRVHFLGHPLLGAPIEHVNFSIERQLQVFGRMLFDPIYDNILLVYPSIMSSWAGLLMPRLYVAIAGDLLFVAVNLILLLRAPRILGVVWAWRVMLYLPSMPFANILPFYLYIPVLGTIMLYGLALQEVAGDLRRRLGPWLQ